MLPPSTRAPTANSTSPASTYDRVLGGDVEQREEGAEEHQRAAQVTDRRIRSCSAASPRPRPRRAAARNASGAGSSAPLFAVPRPRASRASANRSGEEDDDADLRQLRRLKGDRRPDVDAEVVVDPRVARDERPEQEHDPRDRDQVSAPRGRGSRAARGSRRKSNPSTNTEAWSKARSSLIRKITTSPIAASSAQSGNRYGSA